MSTPEEYLMCVHDLQLKKKVLECIKDVLVKEMDSRIFQVEQYIREKKRREAESGA